MSERLDELCARVAKLDRLYLSADAAFGEYLRNPTPTTFDQWRGRKADYDALVAAYRPKIERSEPDVDDVLAALAIVDVKALQA